MFAAESYTSRHHIAIVAMACLCVLLGGPSYAAGAESLIIAESHAPDADITLCGMEVWGDLTLRGTGTLTATGSQCGIHVSRALAVDGCTVDARADGADISDEAVAGVIAES